MTKSFSGVVFDLSDAPIPNAVCTITPKDGLVGQDGGARGANTRTYTADGDGLLTVPAIKIGVYDFIAFIPANPDTSMTIARHGIIQITPETPDNTALELVLNKNAEPITSSLVQQAVQAAGEALQSATLAQAQAGIAVDAAGIAVDAAGQAHASAIVAGAQIYADTTAGLAATSNGDFFYVPEFGGLRIYENDAGSAVAGAFIVQPQFDTLAQLVAAVAAGYDPDEGTVVSANGALFERKDYTDFFPFTPSVPLFADLPGWVIFGPLTVKHLGAIGDGVADDTAAFNRAGDLFRASVNQGNNNNFRREFLFVSVPRGTYLITGTGVNLTSIRGRFWGFVGDGADIICETYDHPTFDHMNSIGSIHSGLSFKARVKSGGPNAGRRIRCAAQYARKDKGFPASVHALRDVTIEGEFDWAPIYNFGSEQFQGTRVFCRNFKPDNDSYALILDGRNYWDSRSAFIPQEDRSDGAGGPIQVNDPVSFLTGTYNNCEFLGGTGGVPGGSGVWISRHSRLKMNECFVSVNREGSRAFVLGCDAALWRDWELTVHIETNYDHAFWFTPVTPSGVGRLDNFSWSENNTHAKVSVFGSDAIDVTITNANITVASTHSSAPSNVFASPGGRFTITGKLATPPLANIDVGGPNEEIRGIEFAPTMTFHGTYFPVGSISGETVTLPRGNYNVVMDDRGSNFKGESRFFGRSSQNTEDVDIDDLSSVTLLDGEIAFQHTTGRGTILWEDSDGVTKARLRQVNDMLRFETSTDGVAWQEGVAFRSGRDMALARRTTDPNSPVGGSLYYNTATNKFRGYVGGNTPGWVDLN